MTVKEGLKNYNVAQKRIIETGKEIEENLVELYHSLKGTGLDVRFDDDDDGGKGYTKITEADDKLKIHSAYWWTDETGQGWAPRWGELYTIEIESKTTTRKVRNFFRKKTMPRKTNEILSIKIKSGTKGSTSNCDGFMIAKLYTCHSPGPYAYDRVEDIPLKDFFQACADKYTSHTENVDRIIESITEFPGKLADHLSRLEKESRKYSTDKMRSDVGRIARTVSNTWLEKEDKEKFKEQFSRLSDDRKKEVIEYLLDSLGSGNFTWAEEWLTKECPELSKKTAMRMMLD